MANRRGFSLLEVGAAGILLVVMLAVCAQFFRATATQHREVQHRRTALRAADNVMERLCARPWQELTPESLAALQLDERIEQALPGSQLDVDVAPSEDDPNAKRITVVVRWPAVSDQPDRVVGLVAWKYRPTED